NSWDPRYLSRRQSLLRSGSRELVLGPTSQIRFERTHADADDNPALPRLTLTGRTVGGRDAGAQAGEIELVVEARYRLRKIRSGSLPCDAKSAVADAAPRA